MKALTLGQKRLTLQDIADVAYHYRPVRLAQTAKNQVQKSQRFLREKIKTDETHYGVNTGFGLLADVKIESKDIETLQYNLIRSHATGTGPLMPDGYVRAMLLLRASQLAWGYSGVRVELIQQILRLLNAGVHPCIPQQGSVGASGDLAPLAHLALVLIGEGRARFQNREMKGHLALKKAGIEPIRLQAKEGLALINGTQFMTAVGALTLKEAQYLCDVADLIGTLSLEALRGSMKAFEPEIHELRPHSGQRQVAERVRKFLEWPQKTEIARSHEGCDRVQDPYSLRCMPQVHGVTRDSLAFVQQIVETEINSVTDNPLVFPERDAILSGGNFHGQYVANAMDQLAISLAELGSIAEQRIEKLVNPSFSRLPAFLAPSSGLNSGFMIVQVSAASVVSENKTLTHPASVDSIPTSAGKEDHVSMGAWAARKAARVLTNVRRVLAMELLCAAQGIDFLRPLKSSRRLEKLHAETRKRSKAVNADRSFHHDIDQLDQWIAEFGLQKLARG